MPVGFENFNDSGSMQLSANLRNPVLRASGTHTTVAGTQIISYTRAASGDSPLLAVAPASGSLRYMGTNFSGLTQNWHFEYFNGAVGDSIPYYVFDKPPAPSGNFGIELYDAAGNLTYSIQNKPLRIVEAVSGAVPPGVALDKTYVAGRQYAAIVSRPSANLIYRTLPNQTDFRGLTVQKITDGIRLHNEVYANATGDSHTSVFGPYQVLITDVTNY